MSELQCVTSVPLPELLAYWLGEMDEIAEARLEQHLFGCAECSGRIANLVNLTQAIRQQFREGRLGTTILTARFVQQLKDAGMRVREYHIQPGGSVNCTIAPDDDLVVSHLDAPLQDVGRLDFIIEGASWRHRLEDIAFDSASGKVVFAPSVAELRKLGVSTHRARLVAVSPGEERVIGDYTFKHSPYR
ncbi:MAG TPA: zf-HC2 domain-containing protein [Steroidobacteraceae bacterium]|nr:zf-HC2 domain-containing protein [Steroidobacteraceae bacterium]